MNLLNLAPDIQEYLLWLPPRTECRITEREMRQIAGEVRWDRQRVLFRQHQRAWMPGPAVVTVGRPQRVASSITPVPPECK
jgi:hypothetical protein